MTDEELIRRAKTGEVIGNGHRQIAILVRELACAEKDVEHETSMYETAANLAVLHQRRGDVLEEGLKAICLTIEAYNERDGYEGYMAAASEHGAIRLTAIQALERGRKVLDEG